MNENSTPSIIIKQLVLIGHRKNYTTKFNPGVNIIYGDADTGKTSIIELIDYIFGYKKFSYYNEIERSVKHAEMEVELNGASFVIKRDIFESKTPVEVYRCSYEELDDHYPEFYSTSRNSTLNNYSDFLLRELNLPNIDVKQSPSKDVSKMVSLSFRDIMKYCHINQDDVGSKNFLDLNNPVVRIKNKETFKYIYNLLDLQKTLLHAEIATASTERKSLESKLEMIAEFLRETEISAANDLNDQYDSIEEQEDSLNHQLNKLNDDLSGSNENLRDYGDIVKELEYQVNRHKDSIKTSEGNVEKFTHLKYEYESDISKLKGMLNAQKILGEEEKVLSNCPICENIFEMDNIKSQFDFVDNSSISLDLKQAKSRIKVLNVSIMEERKKIENNSSDLKKYLADLNKAKNILENNAIKELSPKLAFRDGLISELSKLQERKSKLKEFLKINNKYSNINKAIKKVDELLSKLKEKLEELETTSPSMQDVFSRLGTILDLYLKKVNIKNRTDVSISEKTFMPVIREKEYIDINSGGLRTIASIGYLLTLFTDSLNNSLNLPRFLMIDTVGKYLGKTQDKYIEETDLELDADEYIADPNKYKHMYDYMLDISNEMEDKGLKHQIILVDNDVPPHIAEEYGGFIIAHFSSDGESGLPVGLIDDADEIH